VGIGVIAAAPVHAFVAGLVSFLLHRLGHMQVLEDYDVLYVGAQLPPFLSSSTAAAHVFPSPAR
jgi:hypothetical protein